jgi:hypothetical protein
MEEANHYWSSGGTPFVTYVHCVNERMSVFRGFILGWKLVYLLLP